MSARAPGDVPATHDALFEGRVVFDQPVEGYRAPVDGLLLAAFAGTAAKLAVDLGAGAGMVTLALLHAGAAPRVLAVERDPAMADFLSRNLTANNFTERATVLVADVESAARSRRGSADLVVANPPFWSRTASTAPEHPRADRARRDDEPAAAFLRAARNLLGRGGRCCFVWPAPDLEILLARASALGLHAKRARFVHPLPNREAHRVLVEFKPGRAGGLRIEPALVLADESSPRH